MKSIIPKTLEELVAMVAENNLTATIIDFKLSGTGFDNFGFVMPITISVEIAYTENFENSKNVELGETNG